MKLKRNTNAETKIPRGTVKKSVEEDQSKLEIIEEELEEEGVTLFDNKNVDDDYLTLPRDITEVASIELGRYFNAFTQQKMWTRTLIGRLATTVREMSRSLDDIRADVYANLPAKLSVKEKDLKFQTDKRARKVLDQMFIYEEKLRMLQDYLENLVDGIFNISREISRRGQDFEDDKREDNVNKMRRGRR